MEKQNFIIIDTSNFFTVLTSSIFAQSRENFNLDGTRKVALNLIFELASKFKTNNIYFALDGSRKNLWRKDVLQHYKFRRDIEKEVKDDRYDRKEAYKTIINPLTKELQEFLPFPFIKVDRCEADDIIGVLGNHISQNFRNFIIVSSDQDFDQLIEKNPNVYRIELENFQFIKKDAKFSLMDKIIRGDKGDDIPNAYMENDFLFNVSEGTVQGRQKSINKKVLETVTDLNVREIFPFYERNEKLIDFSKIPTEYGNSVMNVYMNNKKNNNFDYAKSIEYIIESGCREDVKRYFNLNTF